jgi:hypothetical protein
MMQFDRAVPTRSFVCEVVRVGTARFHGIML